jgi:hypothetical protein
MNQTFRSIIDLWPSLQAFADDLGVKYVTAQLMRHRDSIASKHWRQTVISASHRNIPGVTLELLATIEPGAAVRRRKAARSPRHAQYA